MGVSRWVLPTALIALAAGILGADLRLLPAPLWLGLMAAAIGTVGLVGGRAGALAALGGVALAAGALGAWRQEAALAPVPGAVRAADLVD